VVRPTAVVAVAGPFVTAVTPVRILPLVAVPTVVVFAPRTGATQPSPGKSGAV